MKENYELAYSDYKNGMKYKEIAEKYGVTLNTVKSWKTRKWNNIEDEKGVHTKTAKGKGVHTKKEEQERGAPIGNTNAIGNKGNKNASAPKQNSNAEKHGFFSRWLPDETLEIMDAMNERSPADLIWDNIQIQYAAIIRAQKIMHVESKEEIIKELKKAKYEYYPIPKDEGGGMEKATTEEEYEFQFAWDRQATLLNAQSRAMSELRSAIKQFIELSDVTDERRLKLEQMQLNIDKTKVEITNIEGDKDKNGGEDWTQALLKVADRRRMKDEEN